MAILTWIRKQDEEKAKKVEDDSFIDAPALYPTHALPFDSWLAVTAFDAELGRIDQMMDHYVSQ